MAYYHDLPNKGKKRAPRGAETREREDRQRPGRGFGRDAARGPEGDRRGSFGKDRDAFDRRPGSFRGPGGFSGPDGDRRRPSRPNGGRGGYTGRPEEGWRRSFRPEDGREERGNRDFRRFEDERRRPFRPEEEREERGNRDFRRFEDERRRPPRPEADAGMTGYADFEYIPERREAPRPLAEELPPENMLTGRNPIREALKSGRDLEKLLVQKGELSGSAREIVAMAKERHVMIQIVEKKRLDEITPHHQGLIAFASAYQYATVEDMLQEAANRGEEPFLILLDGVTDPHNLGAVIRTAECAGAHGVIVPQHRSVGLTPAAVKASAGAVEHLKVARVTNLNRTIEDLQKRNIWVYAVTMDGEDYESVAFQGGTALVIGAEGEGISRLTAEKCDMTVSLPMKGKIDSLNASVAAGIMMYRVASVRRKAE